MFNKDDTSDVLIDIGAQCQSREEGVKSNYHPCMHPAYILLDGCGVNINYTYGLFISGRDLFKVILLIFYWMQALGVRKLMLLRIPM